MKYKLTFIAALTSVLLLGGPFVSPSQEPPTVTVYVYDSFVSYGAAEVVKQAFEGQFDARVQFVATGPSREMLARLLNEQRAGGTPADVFLGELNDIPKAKQFDLFVPLTREDVPNLENVPESLLVDPDNTLIPYEHGFINLVYNSNRLAEGELPRSFLQLLLPQFREKILVQDPRTSSVGHAFLFWTIHAFGEDFTTYWQLLRPNLLSIFPGWSAAYSAFQNGEAPLVVSFSTDACFNPDFRPVLFGEGQAYHTVFGAAVVKGTDQPELARRFIDTLLSVPVQRELPGTEVMFPANSEAPLPQEWETCAVIPSNPVMLPLDEVAVNNDRWLQEWAEVIVGGP